MILGEKIKQKVYANQQNFVSVIVYIQLLIKYLFIFSFINDPLLFY